ncbi:MAG: hypothetical protein ACFFFT_06425 [Candidatus Thorarchaeota archaeon]
MKRKTVKIIGIITMGIGILIIILSFLFFDNLEKNFGASFEVLILGVFMFCLSFGTVQVTRLLGKVNREIKEAELAFGTVEERALDGYESVINKYRVFVIKREKRYTKSEYMVTSSSGIKLGHFKRERMIPNPIYCLKDLEERPLLTIRRKLITSIFYEGGEENKSKLIGKLKRPKLMDRPNYWFEDPYENKTIIIKGKGFYLYHLIKDNLKEILVFTITKRSIKVKIKPHIPDDIVISILGIATMLQIDEKHTTQIDF